MSPEPAPGSIVGVEKRYLRKSYTHTICVTCALKMGQVKDVACYIAANEDPEWVAAHGDKVSQKEAEVYFPFLADKIKSGEWRYRS